MNAQWWANRWRQIETWWLQRICKHPDILRLRSVDGHGYDHECRVCGKVVLRVPKR